MTDNPLYGLPDEDVPYILATYEGRCDICDEGIHEGDKIKLVEGEWCHLECND